MACSVLLMAGLLLPVTAETVHHDRFEWRPDVDGPTIQIIPPDNWAETDRLTVIIEDPSGVATRQGQILDWVDESIVESRWGRNPAMIPFYTYATRRELTHSPASARTLIDGTEYAVVAQDYHGNFAQESIQLKIDTPITLGTYELDTPFVSEPLSATFCPFERMGLEPGTAKYEVSSVYLSASYWLPWGGWGGRTCPNGEFCLFFGSSSSVRGLDSQGAPRGINGTQIVRDVRPDSLQSSTFDFPTAINLGQGHSGNCSWNPDTQVCEPDPIFGSSISLAFIEPAKISAEIYLYCYVNNTEDSTLGCPISAFENCNIDTFGPFQIEAVRQSQW